MIFIIFYTELSKCIILKNSRRETYWMF